MALFLSTVTNKVDKKGRVSLPAAFRNAFAAGIAQGVVLLKSPKHECLEGFDPAFMESLNTRIDHFDLFSSEQDDLATAIFGEATLLSIDETGRIVLPEILIEYAGLNETASFVGLGNKFQIWTPEKLEERQKQARQNVQDKGLTVPRNSNGGSDA